MRTTKRVGIFVVVEVEAWEGEHSLAAMAATRWPFLRHAEPVEVSGILGKTPVTAKILSADALMYGEVPNV